MLRPISVQSIPMFFVGCLIGCTSSPTVDSVPHTPPQAADPFFGEKSGDYREIAGMKFCWCPPGRFIMGSSRNEPERRPGENQTAVSLTTGFWIGKYEVTQGQWQRIAGDFPEPLAAGIGDDFPMYSINFAEAE